MKLLAVGLARSIWLFQIAEWNPRGRAMHPLFFTLIERYRFIKHPKLSEIDWQKGVKFEDGTYKTSQGVEITVALTVYMDGVIADTRSSTRDSDEFLHEALSFLSEEYNYPDYQTVLRKKLYSSEVFVNIGQSLTSVNQDLQQFANRVSSLVSNEASPFRIGITFFSDPSYPGTQLSFKLEPAAGSPFSENRYYSHAPLKTDEHLLLLEEFESTFLS